MRLRQTLRSHDNGNSIHQQLGAPMQSLFKPFVAVDTPVRYFLALFIMYFGGWHIADDFRFLFGDGNHTDLVYLVSLVVLSTVLTFISRYLAQQKAKRELPK